jgi:hypothetical protein
MYSPPKRNRARAVVVCIGGVVRRRRTPPSVTRSAGPGRLGGSVVAVRAVSARVRAGEGQFVVG